MTHAEIARLTKKALDEAKGKVSFIKRVSNRWPEYLSVVANVVALLSVAYLIFLKNELSSNELAFYQVTIIYVLFVIFLFVLVWQIYTFSRRSRYAETLPYLHAIIHNTRDIVFNLHRHQATDASVKYSTMLNLTYFAQAYSLITGVKCRASFKMVRKATEDELQSAPSKYEVLNLQQFNFIADTYARDAESFMFCGRFDGDSSTPKHWLIANSDFKGLMQAQRPETERYFINNDLSSDLTYDSTSFDLYGKPGKGIVLFGKLIKRGKWTLPYRSTMVWPVRKMTKPGEVIDGQLLQEQDLLGFLCVDSYARGVFEERYDFDYGALVADNMYMLFGAYRAKTQNRLPMTGSAANVDNFREV